MTAAETPPARPRTRLQNIGRRTFILGIIGVVTALGRTISRVMGSPTSPAESPLVVNDVSQLNPIVVSRVVEPTTTEDIALAVRSSQNPIAIGGARHSMGGQIATDGALHLDMRGFNRVLRFSPTSKTITVQSGVTWRQIQEVIDPADLSVRIMQSYANFTVGGSLSVNGHGRYVGLGPLINSVTSLKLVLADGSVVECSPSVRPEIFFGAIGGYGALGVITEATLELTDNTRVKRHTQLMPIADYKAFFVDSIRGDDACVFHNANIFPDDYLEVRAVTFSRTTEPLTISDRLIPRDQDYRWHRLAFWIATGWPLGGQLQEHVVDPIYFSGEPVVWRNYEASYDVAELEPESRETSTYLLQEYFVPLDRFDEFSARMREVLLRRQVNVVNVSIRHAAPDPGSLLAWARTEVFAFVIYYQQGTDPESLAAVGVWTRELIDAALSVDGSYYLPYQLHATEEQFRRAYPRAPELIALKQRLDPENKFRNRLVDKYLRLPAERSGSA